METFLDILKYILPSLVVFFTAYVLIQSFLDSRHKNELVEIKRMDHEIILPLRLQSYERMVLLLERINPVQAIFRVKQAEMSAAQLQSALTQSIREEYEHNIAQQIYISQEAWNQVRNAREEIIRLINSSFIDMKENSTANDLAQAVIENWSRLEVNPTQKALDFLKKEVAKLF